MSRTNRIVVMLNRHGAKRTRVLREGVPVRETYEYNGHTWRVVAVIRRDTIDLHERRQTGAETAR